MLHLIAFDDPHGDLATACLALYQNGDVCVFMDRGALIAADFPRRGPAYLLDGSEAPARCPADLSVIDADRLVTLIAEHGPVTGWYP